MSAILRTLSAVLCCILIFWACKKSSSDGSDNGATIFNVSQTRNTTTSTFRFTVYLDKAAAQEVTLSYSTEAGTALANTDFKPISGTVVIPANQSQGYIDVEVTGDSLRREDQLFYVNLSNAKNCTIKVGKGTGTIVNANGLYFPVNNTGK